MDSTWAMFEARELGVDLSLEGDDIAAKPASRITPELREAIRTNKELLLKDLLLQDALRYMAERYEPGVNLGVLAPYEDRINELYHHPATLKEYRAEIREYVKAGLREFHRVRNAAA